MSGRDRSVLYTIDTPEPQAEARFGSFFAAFGDADGDGTTDVALGTDRQDVHTGSGDPCGTEEPHGCNEDQGKACVFSGEDGSPLPEDCRVDEGEAFVFDGTDGELVRTLNPAEGP